jgi:hypothetical protein
MCYSYHKRGLIAAAVGALVLGMLVSWSALYGLKPNPDSQTVGLPPLDSAPDTEAVPWALRFQSPLFPVIPRPDGHDLLLLRSHFREEASSEPVPTKPFSLT